MNGLDLIRERPLRERILRHLRLWNQHLAPHEGKTKTTVNGPVVLYDYDDDWPRYEESAFVYR